MRQSLESSRTPILDTTNIHSRPDTHSTSRYSTYSIPSMAQTDRSYLSSRASPISPHTQNHQTAPSAFEAEIPRELRIYSTSLARLENKKLVEQRYTVSAEKLEKMQTIALTAKVARGLDRRLVNQDAISKRGGVGVVDVEADADGDAEAGEKK